MGDYHEHSGTGRDASGADENDVRREAVERARRLIADPDYPDRAILERIARLLAEKIENVDTDFPPQSSQ